MRTTWKNLHSGGAPLLNARQSLRAQTVLEYIMMLTAIMIPLAIAVQAAFEDTSEQQKDNLFRSMVQDAYGDESRLGIIGRPYP